MLKTRLVTSFVLIAVFLAALFFAPEKLWWALIAIVMVVAAHEWARLAELSGAVAFTYAATTLIFAASALWYPGYFSRTVIYAGAAVFWLIAAPLWLWRRWNPPRFVELASPKWLVFRRGKFIVESHEESEAVVHWLMFLKRRVTLRLPYGSMVIAAAGWLVLVPTALALIDLRKGGAGFMLALMATVWIADTAAYFSGRRFGRHKLAPQISPGKTWEGVIGALSAVALYAIVLIFAAHYTAAFGLALLLLVPLSIVGDLFESWIKRRAGAKDSGSLLPGHGGVLDRIDGLTAALPLAAGALLLMHRSLI